MPKPLLGKAAVRLIEDRVAEQFDRLRTRLLGAHMVDKQIAMGHFPELTVPGIFEAAAREEGTKADQDTLAHLISVCKNYIDGHESRAKAQVVQSVQAFLSNAQMSGVETNLETVLGGRLTEVWRDVSNGVKTIVDSEVQGAKNMGLLDGILKINTYVDISDPIVYFVVVRDQYLCDECKSLHLQSDGITPRLWKLSTLNHGYHKKGDGVPSIVGEHPHCRCGLCTLMPGYGFDAEGMVTFKSPTHDEWAKQNHT